MQAPVFNVDTKASVQRIIESDYTSEYARNSYFSGLFAAHRILAEAYPGVPMPDELHQLLISAMEACTMAIKGERADGPGAC